MSTSTSATYPGTVANETYLGADWVDGNNVKASDGAWADLGGAKESDSDYLNCTNFGFAIPTGAIIDGIIVEVYRYGRLVDDYPYDKTVQLIKGGSRTGDNKATAPAWSESWVLTTYGNSTDKWGTTWTVADINASNFGVSFQTKAGSDSGTFTEPQIDYIRITIYYTPYIDSGIRYVNAASQVKTIAAETLTASHKFRFNKGGTILGLPLVATDASNAASIRVHDGTSVKSLVNY